MCFKKEYALTIVLVIFSMIVFSQNRAPEQIEVSSNAEVYKALEHLNPGDVLLFTDGNYKDLNLIIINSGTSEQPITIKPKKPGNVFITGDSKVEMRGEHLVLEGFWFKDGNRNIDEWKSHGPGLVAMYGSFNRVTNCVFDSYDEAHSAYITTSLAEDGKVPQYCRIDHCSFTDKITFDQVINLNNSERAVKDGSAGGPPMYHRVDHNFFSNPKKPGNAGGGIRIGYYQNDLGRCLIDSNLFVRQDSEPEIITSKSQENVFYNNTYVNCQGTMNFRHGDRQVAINNFYLGTDTKYEYGGMFVWGSEHVIASNYFELPTTIKSRGNAALYLNPGPIGSEHALFFNSMIVNNVFVNNNGYDIHFNPFVQRREEFAKLNDLNFEAPKQLLLKSNVFYSDQNSSYAFFKDDFSVETNVWQNNIAFGKPLGIPSRKGIQTDYFIMGKDQNIYKPKDEINHIPAVINDILSIEGIDLDLNSLVNKGLQGEPLRWDDVKPYWLSDIPGTYYKNGKLSVERELKFKKVLDRAQNQ